MAFHGDARIRTTRYPFENFYFFENSKLTGCVPIHPMFFRRAELYINVPQIWESVMEAQPRAIEIICLLSHANNDARGGHQN